MPKSISFLVPSLLAAVLCSAAQAQKPITYVQYRKAGLANPANEPMNQPPATGGAIVVQGQMSNGLPIGVPETTGGVFGEPLQRYDSQYPWMHGYFQEIPPYSGYAAFRPYNYKHVLSQSQAAGGWGESPQLPYAQQFWHRYRKRASMLPDPAVSQTRSTREDRGLPSVRRVLNDDPRIIPATAERR